MDLSEMRNALAHGERQDTAQALKNALEDGLETGLEKLKQAGQTALQAAQRASGLVSDAAEKTADTLENIAQPLQQVRRVQEAVQTVKAGVDAVSNVISAVRHRADDPNDPTAETPDQALSDGGSDSETDEDRPLSSQPMPETAETPVPEAEEPQPAPEQPGPKKKLSAFSVIAAALLAVIGLTAVYGIALSLVNYSYAKGLLGSKFVAFSYYQQLLSYPIFGDMLKNSLVLRALQIACGLIVSLPLIAWTSRGKKPGKTLTRACLCLAPYCLPYIVSAATVIKALPRVVMMSKFGGLLMYVLATVLQTAGFIGFCGGLFAYLHMRGIGNGAKQGALLALLISALTLLTPENSVVIMISNGVNRASTQTLGLFAYNRGILSGMFSQSSAASAVQVILQTAVGVFPMILLCRMAKKDETRLEIPDAKPSVLDFTSGKLIWLLILLALAALTFGVETIARTPQESAETLGTAALSAVQEPTIQRSALFSALVAALGSAVGGLAAYSCILHFRSVKKGFGASLLILASSMCFISAQYLGFSSLGLLHSVWPLILRAAVDPRLISLTMALAVALRMAPERRTKGVALGLMLLAAAFAWGDYFSSNLFAYAGGNASLAFLMYQIVMRGTASVHGVTQSALLSSQAMLPVISLMVSLPALALGFGGAAAIHRGFRDAQ